MVVIYTDQDLRSSCKSYPVENVRLSHIETDLMPSSGWAEDVYFWRDGEVKPLKRRNALLAVPEWLKDRKDVDR